MKPTSLIHNLTLVAQNLDWHKLHDSYYAVKKFAGRRVSRRSSVCPKGAGEGS